MIDLWYDTIGVSSSDVSISAAAGYCNEIIIVSAIAFTVFFAAICVAIFIMVGGRR